MTTLQEALALVDRWVQRLDAVTAQRDHWIRLFNRLESAVSHHQRDCQFADLEDESLWAARARIMREAARD